VVSVAATPSCQFLRHADVSSARRIQVKRKALTWVGGRPRGASPSLSMPSVFHAVEAAVVAGERGPRPGAPGLRRRPCSGGVSATVNLVGKPGAGAVGATVSLALAALAAAALLVAPVASQVEPVEVSPGRPTGAQLEQEREVERVSLLEHEGASVLLPLSIPVVIAALGVAAGWLTRPRPLRITSAGLLLAFVVVGIVSIGIYYLPSAIAMVVAAART
jgi:hypothetical protein